MQHGTLRAQVAEVLENYHDKYESEHWVDLFLIGLISLNVIAVVLESVPSIGREYTLAFMWFERFSVAVFTVEYFSRVWCCVDSERFARDDYAHMSIWEKRWCYISSGRAMVDLIAILPFYLSMFTALDLRILRVIRLLRIFKLTRYSNAMLLVINVVRKERRSLMAAIMGSLVIMLLASSGMYLIEHDIQPEKFGSIPDAMWWAMATLTTVGYGDVTPITPLGKFFGGLITITSMGIVALPAGIFASSFSEQLAFRRQAYNQLLTEVLQDGEITESEKYKLAKLRDTLSIDQDDAELMLRLAQEKRHHARFCPNCGCNLEDSQVGRMGKHDKEA